MLAGLIQASAAVLTCAGTMAESNYTRAQGDGAKIDEAVWNLLPGAPTAAVMRVYRMTEKEETALGTYQLSCGQVSHGLSHVEVSSITAAAANHLHEQWAVRPAPCVPRQDGGEHCCAERNQ